MTDAEINLAEARIRLREAEREYERGRQARDACSAQELDQLQESRDLAALEVERCELKVKGK